LLTNNKHSKSLRETSLVIIVALALRRLEFGMLELYLQSEQTNQAASYDSRSNQRLMKISLASVHHMLLVCWMLAWSCEIEASLLGRGTDHP
jgi:hypothetical protein